MIGESLAICLQEMLTDIKCIFIISAVFGDKDYWLSLEPRVSNAHFDW
jgi:hypothetical protein